MSNLIEQPKGYEMPVHTLPDLAWDRVICKGLIPRLLKLLSIDLEKNAEKVAMTELMIRESANRISPQEIEKAFLKYVKGELPLEPMSGYLDPILFGKVIRAYKSQKPSERVEIEELEPSDKYAAENILQAYDEFKETGRVSRVYASAFDRLYEWKILPPKDLSPSVEKRYDYHLHQAHIKISLELSRSIDKEKAKPGASTKELMHLKQERRTLGEMGYNYPEIQTEFRKRVLAGFFEKLSRDKMKEFLTPYMKKEEGND